MPTLDLSAIKFQRFFDTSLDMLCIVDADGNITYLNSRWTDILGHAIGELMGNGFMHYLHPDDAKSTIKSFKQVLGDKLVTDFQNRYRSSDGKYRWISWNATYDQEQQLVYCIGRDVTEQKRIQACLEILEETTGVGVWDVDPPTDEVYWSNKVYDIHEADAATFNPGFQSAVAFYTPEAQKILAQYLEKLAGGEKITFELPLTTARGKRIWVESNASAEVRDGIVVRQYGTFEDITEKREERINNEKLKERVDLAMKASKIGVWEYDSVTDKLSWDDQMFEIYDVDKRYFSGTFADWENTVLPEDLIAAKKTFEEAIQTDKIFANQFRILTREKQTRYISAIGKVINDAQSGTTYITGVNWDVTNEEIARQALLEAKEQAEAADIAKSTFLASMSHEIRTPLNGIFGALQLLKNQKQAPEQRKLLDTALNATNGLTRIINDILDFSKIQANKLVLDYMPVDIAQLAQDVIDEQSLLKRQESVKTVISISESAKGYWLADPLRLKQIFNNLLSNAFKFTPEGTIKIELNAVNDMLRIIVSDTGIGMSKDEIKHLFDPFTQANSATSRKFGGTGLGLAISENLISLFGGSIKVASTLTKGSTFTIDIPFERSVNMLSDALGDVDLDEIDIRGTTIFVAEDNAINQTVISEMLKSTKASFYLFNDGEELLEGYRRKRPDLILCDIHMPVLDGLAACKAIRKSDQQTPIIAFTANVMGSDTQKYLANGFNDILGKPLLMSDLNHLLLRYLKPTNENQT
ncbi:MAG: PAS domain-containing protein [Pseudomonadota bacterium]